MMSPRPFDIPRRPRLNPELLPSGQIRFNVPRKPELRVGGSPQEEPAHTGEPERPRQNAKAPDRRAIVQEAARLLSELIRFAEVERQAKGKDEERE